MAGLEGRAAAQRRALFAEDLGQAARAAVGDPMVVRSRETDVDLSLLVASGATPGFAAPMAARSVVLNLFRDAEYVAFFDRVETVSTIGYAWVGTVSGIEGSQVVLAVSDGVFTASVELPNEAYSVRPMGAGRYVVAQIDRRALAPDAPPLSVTPSADARGDTGASAAVESGEVYDLLLLYTAQTRLNAGGTAAMNSLITAAVARVNAAYTASSVPTRCRLAAAAETAYVESGDIERDLPALRSNGAVRALRDRYAADVVSLVIAQDPNWGGFGYIMRTNDTSFAPWAYSVVVHYTWLSYLWSLAHEIGHNQGAHHEPGNGCPGLFWYSCGYTDFTNKFRTIMSYGTGCSNCSRINQFSSPVVTYRGAGTGTATQDNARTLTNSRVAVANFRQSGTQTLGAPSGLTASAAGSNVRLAWTAPSVGTPTSYIVEAGSAPGLANLAAANTGSTATSFATSGVPNGAYYVRVRATNAAGTSAPSNEATLIVGPTPCTTPPPAPSGLSVSKSGTTVTFTWAASAGASSYMLEAGSSPGAANLFNQDIGATITLTASAPNGLFYVRVRAKNACGLSGPSNEVVFTIP